MMKIRLNLQTMACRLDKNSQNLSQISSKSGQKKGLNHRILLIFLFSQKQKSEKCFQNVFTILSIKKVACLSDFSTFYILFKLENKFYTVNIFVYVLCCFITKRNCFCLLYIYSIALVVAKW